MEKTCVCSSLAKHTEVCFYCLYSLSCQRKSVFLSCGRTAGEHCPLPVGKEGQLTFCLSGYRNWWVLKLIQFRNKQKKDNTQNTSCHLEPVGLRSRHLKHCFHMHSYCLKGSFTWHRLGILP